ncbi:unnamed protein product, partial [Discosporangium mesarthrocarpum]
QGASKCDASQEARRHSYRDPMLRILLQQLVDSKVPDPDKKTVVEQHQEFSREATIAFADAYITTQTFVMELANLKERFHESQAQQDYFKGIDKSFVDTDMMPRLYELLSAYSFCMSKLDLDDLGKVANGRDIKKLEAIQKKLQETAMKELKAAVSRTFPDLTFDEALEELVKQIKSGDKN